MHRTVYGIVDIVADKAQNYAQSLLARWAGRTLRRRREERRQTDLGRVCKAFWEGVGLI